MSPARLILPVTLCLIGGAVLSVASAWAAEWAAPATLTTPPGGWAELTIPAGSAWPFPHDALWTTKLAAPEGPTRGTQSEIGHGLTVRFLEARTEEESFLVVEFRSGWPFRCMHRGLVEWTRLVWSLAPALEVPFERSVAGLDLLGKGSTIQRRDQRGPARFPVLPLWPGFGVNTAFYAGALGVSIVAPGAARRAWRRRKGLCERCGYPRAGDICPECGPPQKRDHQGA